MSFKKSQMDLIKALENLYEVGGHLEKGRVCDCLDKLHNQVFALSYEDVYKRSQSLMKRCKKSRS